MDKNGLGFVEYFILDTIHCHENIDDFAASKQLRCSRSFLLSKLEYLLLEDYIVRTPKGYILSDKGSKMWIPFTNRGHQGKEASIREKSVDLFDWTVPYIPPVGWQDQYN